MSLNKQQNSALTELALKDFLYCHSFYNLDENFDHDNNNGIEFYGAVCCINIDYFRICCIITFIVIIYIHVVYHMGCQFKFVLLIL